MSSSGSVESWRLPWWVYTSLTTGEEPVPSESRLTELEPVGVRWRRPWAQRLARWIGRIVAWIRGHVRR